jgi:hypothetical protein
VGEQALESRTGALRTLTAHRAISTLWDADLSHSPFAATGRFAAPADGPVLQKFGFPNISLTIKLLAE